MASCAAGRMRRPRRDRYGRLVPDGLNNGRPDVRQMSRWPSVHAEVLVVRGHQIQPSGQFRKATGRHGGKQMVLHVVEHVVGEEVRPVRKKKNAPTSATAAKAGCPVAVRCHATSEVISHGAVIRASYTTSPRVSRNRSRHSTLRRRSSRIWPTPIFRSRS